MTNTSLPLWYLEINIYTSQMSSQASCHKMLHLSLSTKSNISSFPNMLQAFNLLWRYPTQSQIPINNLFLNISEHKTSGSSIILMLLLSSSYPYTIFRNLSSNFISLVIPNTSSGLLNSWIMKIHLYHLFLLQGIHYHNIPYLSTREMYPSFYLGSLLT